MATCKDCIHYNLCRSISRIQLGWRGNSVHYVENVEEICKDFKGRSRFVELPNDFPKGRLTTNKPLGNFDALMNYAYAKDGNVLLRYANNQENMDLCDYIAHHAKCDCAINAQEVLDGACFECDDFYCPLGRAYFASVQAAELRERLKMYEDLAEQALKERESNE